MTVKTLEHTVFEMSYPPLLSSPLPTLASSPVAFSVTMREGLSIGMLALVEKLDRLESWPRFDRKVQAKSLKRRDEASGSWILPWRVRS